MRTFSALLCRKAIPSDPTWIVQRHHIGSRPLPHTGHRGATASRRRPLPMSEWGLHCAASPGARYVQLFRRRFERSHRRDARCLHALRQVRRGLPGEDPGGRRRRARSRDHRRDRHPARRRRHGGFAPLGVDLHAHRRMHQGVRGRRQPALPPRDGAARHGAKARRSRTRGGAKASTASASSISTSPCNRGCR